MSGGIISYKDYINEDKTKVYKDKVLTEYNERVAKSNYNTVNKQAHETKTEIKKQRLDILKDEMDKVGVKMPETLKFSTPTTTAVKNDNGTVTFKSPYDKEQEKVQEQKKSYAAQNKILRENEDIQALNELYKKVNNERLLAKYNYDYAKEANHDINLYDRTLGVPIRAIKDFFQVGAWDTDDTYHDEKGNSYILPQDYEMRQENVRNSYGDDLFGKVAKFGTDLGYNMTKIGLSTAINAVVPYGGSAMYFTDMGVDSFNQAKRDGYDDKSAALYSVVNVASEMVTEKLLGGFSKLMGGESAMSSSLNKKLSSIMKNDRLRSALSNALSEGTEEFTQEFIEKFSQNMILKKNSLGESAKDTFLNPETWSDAAYSTLLGMASGGMMGTANVEINTNNTGVIPNVNKGGTINIDSYANQLQSALNETNNQSKINNINQTLDYLALNKAAGNELVQSQNLNQNIKTTVPKSNEMVLPKASDNQTNSNLNENNKINRAEDHYMIKSVMDNSENNTSNFSQQVDAVLDGTFSEGDVLKVLDHTPQVLQDIGLNDLPITLTQKHLQTIMNKEGKYKNSNYHDLGIDVVKQIPEALNHPLNVLKSDTRSDSVVVVTELSDKQNNIVLASIKLDGQGNINGISIDTNHLTSAYGKNNYDAFMKKNINKGNLLYDIDQGIIKKLDTSNRFQLPIQSPTSYMDNTITNSSESQVSPNNSNMQFQGNDVLRAKQNVENNTKSYTPSEIKNFFQYTDTNNRKIALPDEVGQRLATKTTMTPIEVGRLQSIINSSYDTQINGNHLELLSDYDNNLFNIKATKIGDTYVIDDVVKTSKNSLGSISNNQNNDISNTKSNNLNEKSSDDVIRHQTDNKSATKIDNDIKNNYKNTVDKSVDMKESKFYKNATETSKYITEDNRSKLSQVGDLKYYESVSNEESLNKASKRLKENGTAEAFRWLQQDTKTSDASDVAEGWILLKNYQDAGDFDSMVAVAKKMREMGTTAGQTVQAYNIMQRLTPEGMVKYAQSELSEAYEFYAKNKSKEWVQKNASKFDLNAQEVEFIVDTMKQVQNMEDGRAKNVKLGEIQKMLTDKLPPEKGANIKAWMRISMLFNPKTQVRNVMGNTLIAPVNMVGDYFASKADKMIAKKTGVRTTGTTDIKSYLKGFKKGVYESYDDFKRGINTRDVNGNRFELGQGKSFNDNTKLGKALNKIDTLNGFLLDAGDRGFYEGSFTNSINNQLALNNTTKVTQSMIDIATSEALSRTWQDNNNYTKFVLSTRNMLNKVNVKGYGLGDILIPFAKTPANLTKAIVDYSPAGVIKVLSEYKNLKNNISTGTNTAMQQHQFVQDLGKATAGTMLYVAAYGLAKAGIVTGKSDDDKDTRDFIKNTLGVSSYSITIGGKSFTYDWAQPIAAPLSIMTNIVNSNNKGQALLEAVTSSLDSAGSILMEQSFVKSINEVLTNNDGIASGIENAILDLPTRAIPTFMKQIVDMTDGTQRQTYEYKQPLKTAVNKLKAKIPGLSTTLTPSVDTMGREIQKYGGKNNIFNVFLNPANVNTSSISEAAQEIYRVYKEVGDNSIMPRVAPYYINSKGEKTILTTEQRKDFQKIAGKLIEDSVNELKTNNNYKNMSDTDKSDAIKDVVDYAYNKARKDVLGIELANKYNKITEWLEKGGTVASYYANQKEVNYSLQNPERYNTIKNFGVDYNDYELYQEKVSEIKKQYEGTQNQNVRKQKVFEYINSLNATKEQKIVLYKLLGGYSIKSYQNSLYNQINSFNLPSKEKQEIWKTLF